MSEGVSGWVGNTDPLLPPPRPHPTPMPSSHSNPGPAQTHTCACKGARLALHVGQLGGGEIIFVERHLGSLGATAGVRVGQVCGWVCGRVGLGGATASVGRFARALAPLPARTDFFDSFIEKSQRFIDLYLDKPPR